MALSIALPACAQPPALSSPDGSFFTVEQVGNTLKAQPLRPNGSHAPTLAADARLRAALQGTQQTIVLADRAFQREGKQFLVVAVARPSKKTQGRGYCGAGTEDHLLLIEMQADQHRLALRDDMLVQSCLKSMALQSDQGTELKAVLGAVSTPDPLQLTWLSHPEFAGQTKTFTVVRGKWVLQQ